MNRQIKFRVWDKLGKRMLEAPLHIALWTQTEPEDFELIQYTGLKDKNGKELYEGDLVHHTRPDGIYVVEWVDGAASFALRKHDHTMWLGKLCEPLCEIIGNIFENPGLLKHHD